MLTNRPRKINQFLHCCCCRLGAVLTPLWPKQLPLYEREDRSSGMIDVDYHRGNLTEGICPGTGGYREFRQKSCWQSGRSFLKPNLVPQRRKVNLPTKTRMARKLRHPARNALYMAIFSHSFLNIESLQNARNSVNASLEDQSDDD